MDRLEGKFDDLKDWVEMVVGGFQTRSGRRLEDVVAGALRLALERPEIDPGQIRMRQRIEDREGVMGPQGRNYEVDILAENDRMIAFEVKSVCEVEDVDRHADKVELLRVQNPGRHVEGVMIALTPARDVAERCQARGLRLVGRVQE